MSFQPLTYKLQTYKVKTEIEFCLESKQPLSILRESPAMCYHK